MTLMSKLMDVNDHVRVVLMGRDMRVVDAMTYADDDAKIVYHMNLIDWAITDANVVWLKLVSAAVLSINASLMMTLVAAMTYEAPVLMRVARFSDAVPIGFDVNTAFPFPFRRVDSSRPYPF